MGEPIDCRGLACPEPVLRAKSALEALEEGVVSILVDADAPRENVKRFAERQGCAVRVADEGGAWRLEIVKGIGCEVPEADRPAPGAATEGSAILVTSDAIGPEPKLGGLLMRSFLATLLQAPEPPRSILFLNRGVLLTTAGSEALDVIRDLEAAGVEVFSCGTCLEYFERKEGLEVGRVSNMYDTVETLTGPLKVVTVG